MRHLELPSSQNDFDVDVKSECSIDIKVEDLEDLGLKDDFMDEIPLDVTLETNIKENLSEDEIPKAKPRRRKNAQPQKAVQEQNIIVDNNEPAEGEDDSRDNDSDIFRGLKEETGEEFDEEVQKSVKEEWKAHWGVKCNMCEKVFTFKPQFDKHYRNNYNRKPQYTCSYCNKTMDKYTTFRSHCYRHITEGRYRCYKCNKGFSLESMLHDHILAKHTEVKPFICEECGKGFVTKPGLKIHLNKHKNGDKEDYPCAECGKVLHTRGGLTAHMNVHRLGRRFMCDVCGKTFTQKVNMQQHVKHHNGERPFSCDKCGKSFAGKSHLARHYSFHSEKRPFKCEVCQKMYKTERCLKVHSMVHATSRPFVCSYCGKGFLSSTKLKQHLNIHTGQRPFKCKYCERTFTNYPNWLKHTRRRHKVDHKTGLDLVPPKTEAPSTPAPQDTHDQTSHEMEQHQVPIGEISNFVMDFAMREELMQFEDRTIQQMDFSSISNSHPVNLVIPYQDPLEFISQNIDLMQPSNSLNFAQEQPQQLIPVPHNHNGMLQM